MKENYYTLFVISKDEDFIIVCDNYCEKTLHKKYNIICEIAISKEEALKYHKENGIRLIKIPCKCEFES